MEHPVSPEERAAIRAARKGDRAAFGVLVRQYQRRAYAAAFTLVGNREDALEIAQDALVRAYKAMPRFDPSLPFYPWLHRIVRNVALNHLRKRHRRGERSLDAMMEEGFDIRSPDPGASSGAELDDLRHQIRAALAGLSAEHQEILRLRHFLDLSYAEIAACLEIPTGTVMSRLHAARKALRRAMEIQPAKTATL